MTNVLLAAILYQLALIALMFQGVSPKQAPYVAIAVVIGVALVGLIADAVSARVSVKKGGR